MNAALQVPTQLDDYRSGAVIDGRYRLLRLLEEGGMSWVWLGHHMALDVPVAVKIGKRTATSAPERCVHEARIAAALRHPSIVAVVDSGRTEWGDPFIVMEHLEGCSLAQVLARDGRINAQAAVTLMIPVLDALSFCHERGILHRDIKPANVFLARERDRTYAKLLDFGLACPISSSEPMHDLSGTPGYMAPEQVLQDRVDQRADVWSVCALLYEVVAGRPAIAGRTCAELLMATTASVIEPLPARKRGESGLWAILQCGLRAAPMERFPTMRALTDTLTAWVGEQGESLARQASPCSEEVRASDVDSGAQWISERPTHVGSGPVVRDDRALCDSVAARPHLSRQRRALQWHWMPPGFLVS